MLDALTAKEIVRFLIPTALGCLAYVLATLAAGFVASTPRQVYIARLAFLAVFVLLLWGVYFPTAELAFSGNQERYYRLGGEARGMGTIYGMHTTWIWCIIALLKRTKEHHENAG